MNDKKERLLKLKKLSFEWKIKNIINSMINREPEHMLTKIPIQIMVKRHFADTLHLPIEVFNSGKNLEEVNEFIELMLSVIGNAFKMNFIGKFDPNTVTINQLHILICNEKIK